MNDQNIIEIVKISLVAFGELVKAIFSTKKKHTKKNKKDSNKT